MTITLSQADLAQIRRGYHPDASRSLSLSADAYTQDKWFRHDLDAIFARTWQWVCHVEKLRLPGSYRTIVIAGRPIAVVRDRDGILRAFYNVCKHRAHELLQGEGRTTRMMCPYHAWVYDLTGQLRRAPETENLEAFSTQDICLDAVQVEEFCGFIYVNLDPEAAPLAEQSGDLAAEILHWAPDVSQLTFGHRLTYDIKSNWKNV
ncbi:MAG: Rieske (2Fe-2S) protein, partial [Pseudomonadota bacterium]